MIRIDRVQQVPTPRVTREPLLAVFVAFAIAALAGCAGGGDPPTRATPSSGPLTSDEADPSISSPAAEETSPAALPEAPSRTIEQSGGFKLASLSSASCTAEAPFDWTMQAPDRSDWAELLSPDGTMYAGHGIQAVNTALHDLAYAYRPPLNDPDLYSNDPASVALAHGRIVVSAMGGDPDLSAAGDPVQPTPDYLLLPVSGSTHQGVIFFRANGFPGDDYNYSYALPMYFAFTTTEL